MRDARVREHPLDVRLRHADHGPDDHRRGGDAPTATGAPARRCSGSNADRNTRDERGERRRLHAGRHEAGDRRRRAFVGVGRPHVERHRRHLEREADEQQAERQQLHRRRRHRLRRHAALPMRSSRVLPVSAVGERDAVEEERARERAEQEVLERRLGRRRRVAADAGQHVDRERQHLEREEDDQQVGRRRHQHHAGEREQHQRVVLAARAAARARSSAPRTPATARRRRSAIAGDEQAEVVGDDDAEARRRCWFHSSDRRDRRADQADDAERRRSASARPARGTPRRPSRQCAAASRRASGRWR